MPSLSRSRKAQFFVLSAFAIVTIIYFVSKWMEPYTIIDTSSVVMVEEPFIFNNIAEKAAEVVKQSKNCDDLKYNLEEYKVFVEKYGISKNFDISLIYSISQPCNDNDLTTTFGLSLKSPRTSISSQFAARK